jgi:hypothetical protein
MRKPLRLIGFLAICAVLLVPLGVLADDIAPSSVTGSFTVGGSYNVDKTVTVSAGTATAANADIFLLADNTGSMYSLIASAQTGAADIVTKTTGIGGGTTQWAVGSYRDFYTGYETKTWGSPGDYPYQLNQALTTSSAAVVTGIGAWSAGGGNDYPEANLYAVQQAATTAGWRSGSARFIVQFGDSPGHEPSNTLGYPGPSTAQTITSLTSNNVKLIAVNLGTKDAYGQETAMTTASGGALYNGYSGSIADFIKAAIEESFSTYHTVSLDLADVPAGVTASFTPLVFSDSFDRSIERTFDFDLLFGFTAAGHYEFDIYALVDGFRVATEHDVFDVVPVPASVLLLGSGLLGLIPLRRKKLF